MDAKTAEAGIEARRGDEDTVATAILVGISFAHCLNDLIQSLVPAIYPILKTSYALDFGQVGLITLVFQVTASLLQPVVGIYTDRHPKPFSLAAGMFMTLVGLLLLSVASSYAVILCAAALIGTGSSIFHPESSRVARMASGGRPGTAQSTFQVGGNVGSAIGPLLAAFIVVPRGQGSLAWFSLLAVIGMIALVRVGRWYRDRLVEAARRGAAAIRPSGLSRRRIGVALTLLGALVLSKSFYMASFGSYYTFYLIHHFGLSVSAAQLCLFVFLGSVAVGTILGGPLGDRIGRKLVIWVSILGALPFTLLLPYAGLASTIALTIPIGLIVASATPQIVVFGQELLPGRVGLVSGIFLGLAFGAGGLGAAVLGEVADRTSIEYVFWLTSFLPAIGLVAAFLPNMHRPRGV